MSLFKKIANLISEKSKEGDVEGKNTIIHSPNEEKGIKDESNNDGTSHSKVPLIPNDGTNEGGNRNARLETKEDLLFIMCDLCRNLFVNLEMNVPHNLVIWLDTDLLTFQTYDTNQFRERILEALVNECDVKLETVTFSIGRPTEDLRCTPIGQSGKLFLQINDSSSAPRMNSLKATISILGNAGSLLKDEYILSSEEMEEQMISAYNIGAGEFPKIPSGFRHNHIAIDDNPQSPMFENNKYVSRMHAHIGYSDKFGFFLQVERDGTRLMGKRTRIFRGEQIIEMDNITVKEPLQDGDLIELGKAVRLSYVEIKN